MARKDWIIVALILAILIGPLLFWAGAEEAEFGGTDGQATDAIVAQNPDYEPWFDFVWEPPSGELESLLFTLQATLGAGMLGFYIGLRKGQTGRRADKIAGRPASEPAT